MIDNNIYLEDIDWKEYINMIVRLAFNGNNDTEKDITSIIKLYKFLSCSTLLILILIVMTGLMIPFER